MPTILIQQGHVHPREKGFEDGTGATGEQEVVRKIGVALAGILGKDSRFTAKVIPGAIPLEVKSGAFQVDAFLSLHCDGSRDPNRRGWGVGYPAGKVNQRFAALVAEEIARFHPSERIRDNYTPNMSGYYGWSRVPTPGPEVLVEHGFVSSPAERKYLLDNIERFARAEYMALLRFYDLPVKPPKPAGSWITPEEARDAWDATVPIWKDLPGPRGKPEWFWQADKELQRRRSVLRDA